MLIRRVAWKESLGSARRHDAVRRISHTRLLLFRNDCADLAYVSFVVLASCGVYHDAPLSSLFPYQSPMALSAPTDYPVATGCTSLSSLIFEVLCRPVCLEPLPVDAKTALHYLCVTTGTLENDAEFYLFALC